LSYLDKLKRHEQREARSPLVDEQTSLLQSGDRITWQGSDGKANNGVVDFLHTYPGEVWIFCTLPDGGWIALNAKYVRKE